MGALGFCRRWKKKRPGCERPKKETPATGPHPPKSSTTKNISIIRVRIDKNFVFFNWLAAIQ
eukprot:gene9323-6560_t